MKNKKLISNIIILLFYIIFGVSSTYILYIKPLTEMNFDVWYKYPVAFVIMTIGYVLISLTLYLFMKMLKWSFENS